MSCSGCGEKLKQAGKSIAGAVGQVRTVSGAYAALMAERYFTVGEKFHDTDRRVDICVRCDDSTWLSTLDFAGWVCRQDAVELIQKANDLASLPPLDIQSYDVGRKLFCSKCKCFIPAKARLPDEECPAGKW